MTSLLAGATLRRQAAMELLRKKMRQLKEDKDKADRVTEEAEKKQQEIKVISDAVST